MQYDKKGRLVKTVEEAEQYVRYFIAESRKHEHERFAHYQMEYDLYLPWLGEVVENMRLSAELDPSPTALLERLYMEAVWSLCMQGYLRPGPKKLGYDNMKDCYGKGFSLTYKGDEWIESYVSGTAADAWPAILTR